MRMITVFFTILVLIGCSSKPDETDCKSVATNLIAKNYCMDYMDVVKINKNNAYDGTDPYNGQAFHAIRTTVTIRILKECEWNPNRTFSVTTKENKIFKEYYRPTKPGIYTFNYSFAFYKTERGWEGEDKQIY